MEWIPDDYYILKDIETKACNIYVYMHVRCIINANVQWKWHFLASRVQYTWLCNRDA